MRLGSRANAAARRLGWEVQRFDPQRSKHARRQEILRTKHVDLLLDVGGNVGAWGQLIRRTGYGGRIASFEPVSSAFAKLQQTAATDAGWECHRLALGDRNGAAEIGVSENLGSSSFLEIERRHVEASPGAHYVTRESVELARLDSMMPKLGDPQERIYMKLDVQGYELKVLEGAAATLPRVVAIETEVNLVKLYEGQPSICDLLAALEPIGFELFALEPCFVDERSGQMLEVDALLVRR